MGCLTKGDGRSPGVPGLCRGVDGLKMDFHVYQAGDVPFMPEQAELIADMWKQNLGIEAEVVVGDVNTIRQQWFSREIDGDAQVRPNEVEWDGMEEVEP